MLAQSGPAAPRADGRLAFGDDEEPDPRGPAADDGRASIVGALSKACSEVGKIRIRHALQQGHAAQIVDRNTHARRRSYALTPGAQDGVAQRLAVGAVGVNGDDETGETRGVSPRRRSASSRSVIAVRRASSPRGRLGTTCHGSHRHGASKPRLTPISGCEARSVALASARVRVGRPLTRAGWREGSARTDRIGRHARSDSSHRRRVRFRLGCELIEDACAYAWLELLVRLTERINPVGWLRVVAGPRGGPPRPPRTQLARPRRPRARPDGRGGPPPRGSRRARGARYPPATPTRRARAARLATQPRRDRRTARDDRADRGPPPRPRAAGDPSGRQAGRPTDGATVRLRHRPASAPRARSRHARLGRGEYRWFSPPQWG